MIFKFTEDNILDTDRQMILNIVKCNGEYLTKTGLAFHEKYPILEEKMQEFLQKQSNGIVATGSIQFAHINENQAVVHLFINNIQHDLYETLIFLRQIFQQHNYSVAVPTDILNTTESHWYEHMYPLLLDIFNDSYGSMTFYRIPMDEK